MSMSEAIEINRPDVKLEVEAIFAVYEKALVSNDVATLDNLFWQSERTVRYGARENLYGIEEILVFRRARDPSGLDRVLHRTEITTFGRDMATSMTLFTRASTPQQIGRQSQTWLKFPEGWKVVAAHVSMIDV